MKMKENKTRITLNEPMGLLAYRLRFEVDWDSFDPGQFVMVRVPGGEVFLRRPFGIADLSGGSAEICYKVVGRGTEALTHAAVGTELSVTGPCGKGFERPASDRTAVLVAGGYGIGPLLGLCRNAPGERAIYYGAKSKDHFLYLDELRGLGVKAVLATEDGSLGEKGLITKCLERDLGRLKNPALLACGPRGMLAAVAKLGMKKKIPTQVSTEEYMACGIGVCMGCACKDRDGNFVSTCKDGPIFDAKELKWD
jgi:dihydroorotate dehydrogenase electron transfer subunit